MLHEAEVLYMVVTGTAEAHQMDVYEHPMEAAVVVGLYGNGTVGLWPETDG